MHEYNNSLSIISLETLPRRNHRIKNINSKDNMKFETGGKVDFIVVGETDINIFMNLE